MILAALERGDAQAAEQLLPLVYDELRKLAAQRLAQEKPGQTLQATALVHEAYLRLVGRRAGRSDWDGRGHFFAAAAEAMRRILIDNARRKARPEARRAARQRVDLDEAAAVTAARRADDDLLALDEALTRLAAQEPVKAELVKLRFFAGLTIAAGGRSAGHLAGDRRAVLDLRPRAGCYCELERPPRPDAPSRSEKSCSREGVAGRCSHCSCPPNRGHARPVAAVLAKEPAMTPLRIRSRGDFLRRPGEGVAAGAGRYLAEACGGDAALRQRRRSAC